MRAAGGGALQEAHPCTCRLAHSVGKAVLPGNWSAPWRPHELGATPEGGAPKTGKPGLQEAEGQTLWTVTRGFKWMIPLTGDPSIVPVHRRCCQSCSKDPIPSPSRQEFTEDPI